MAGTDFNLTPLLPQKQPCNGGLNPNLKLNFSYIKSPRTTEVREPGCFQKAAPTTCYKPRSLTLCQSHCRNPAQPRLGGEQPTCRSPRHLPAGCPAHPSPPPGAGRAHPVARKGKPPLGQALPTAQPLLRSPVLRLAARRGRSPAGPAPPCEPRGAARRGPGGDPRGPRGAGGGLAGPAGAAGGGRSPGGAAGRAGARLPGRGRPRRQRAWGWELPGLRARPPRGSCRQRTHPPAASEAPSRPPLWRHGAVRSR